MAWTDYLQGSSSDPAKKLSFFNVTQSVGWRSARTGVAAPNMLTDMMLVAYFLNYIYRQLWVGEVKPSQWETIPLPGMIPEMMMADRKATINNLSYWIKHFQRRIRGLTADGRVDLGTARLSTIFMLNTYFSYLVEERFNEPDYQKFMLNDSNPMLMPPSLKTELSYDPNGN